VGLAALLFLHDAFRPMAALGAWVLAGLVTLAVRRSWADLPGFVTGWLDAGVLTVGVLVVAASTGFTSGVPYAVLRASRTVALLGAAGLLGTGVAGLAYTHHRLAGEVRQAAERLAEARRRALESRLAALSAQINPHVLFNTLNALAEVVHQDEDRAEDMIHDLAALMRYALDSANGRVTLQDELHAITRLLRIEQARLGERLTVDVQIEPAAGQALLPALLVQPLVENAVRHGISARSEPGRLTVRARVDRAHVEVTVQDDGPGVPPDVRASLGVPLAGDAHPGGLRNVQERVALTWPPGTASLTVDEPTVGARMILRFPLEVR
jgi:LytS/YehU family sensor histidine kinase